MTRLPPIEVKAIWAREELHRGNREKGLLLLTESGDGPIARELRSAVAKRGRQPFGRSHLWWNIGVDNDELVDQGVGWAERLERLGVAYLLHSRQIEEALAKYNDAIDEIRSINPPG